MKIKVNRTDLAQKLALAKKATVSRPIIPNTGNILLSGDGQQLVIKSCDTMVGILQELPADISGNTIRAMSAPAELLQNMVNNLNADELQIEFAKDSIKLSTGKARASVKALPEYDFPLLPRGHRKLCTLSAELMGIVKNLFVPFVVQDESHQALRGVFLSCENNQLEIISGSDWRGSYWVQPFESEDFQVLIPAAERSIIKECSGQTEVWMSESGNHAILKTDEAEFSTTLYDANTYPKQRGGALATFAKEKGRVIKVSANALLEAVRLVDPVSNKINHEISMEALRSDDENAQLKLYAESAEKGTGVTWIDCSLEGENTCILVDARNLIGILTPLRADDLLIRQPDGCNFIIFQVEGNEHFYHGLAQLGRKPENVGS